MKEKFLNDYKEFCEIFKGLTFNQAKERADLLKLYNIYDNANNLVDIMYKDITATVYGNNISGYVECWQDDNLVGFLNDGVFTENK